MFRERWHRPIPFFGALHDVTLAIIALCIVLLCIFRKKFGAGTTADKVFRYTATAVLVGLETGFLIWSGMLRNFKALIPLELCSIMLWTTALATLFNWTKVFKVLFFWAVLGTALPFFIITIDYVFPHFRFIHYFTIHMLIMLLNLYPVITGRISLRYRDLALSCGILLLVGGIVYPVNIPLHTNFMFLQRLPGPLGALSDKLGPLYLLPFALAVFAGFHIEFGVYKLILLIKTRMRRTEKRADMQRGCV